MWREEAEVEGGGRGVDLWREERRRGNFCQISESLKDEWEGGEEEDSPEVPSNPVETC